MSDFLDPPGTPAVAWPPETSADRERPKRRTRVTKTKRALLGAHAALLKGKRVAERAAATAARALAAAEKHAAEAAAWKRGFEQLRAESMRAIAELRAEHTRAIGELKADIQKQLASISK